MCSSCDDSGATLAVLGADRHAHWAPCPACSPRRCHRHRHWLASCEDCTAFWMARFRP